MWKESYRIGIDPIDNQHIELFRMTDNLLKAIESNASREAYQQAIAFLKGYVVMHFRDEEAYQESIGYSGLEEHKKAHRAFTNQVLEFEKRLTASNYDVEIVKELAGTLTAWLIYHVADADQRIAKGDPAVAAVPEDQTYAGSFSASVQDVLEKMAGLNPADMKEKEADAQKLDGDVYVKIGLVGDVNGDAVFGFSRELAFKLLEIMTFTEPEEIDEMVCSALAELSNISCGNAATALEAQGLRCNITTPEICQKEELVQIGQEAEGVHIETNIGGMQLAVSLQAN